MGANTKIEWAHHTFNPWRGCTKVADGCANCYAEAQSKRNPAVLGIWGPNGTRVVASEATWKQPLKWNAAAACCCRKGPLDHEHEPGCPQRDRPRVFCASLADVFEDWSGCPTFADGSAVCACRNCGKGFRRFGAGANPPHCADCDSGAVEMVSLNDVRRRLFALIDATPNLDWLLLTKRPENVQRMWPAKDDCKPIFPGAPGNLGKPLPCKVMGARRENVWLGTSISTQADANRNVLLVLKCRDLSPVLFVSAEPLLDAVALDSGPRGGYPRFLTIEIDHCEDARLDWVIVGGESGPHARPCPLPAVRSLVRQCGTAGVPCFIKQLGSNSVRKVYGGPAVLDGGIGVHQVCHEFRNKFFDKKGGDPAEWPEDLRVRQLPKVSPHLQGKV